MTITTRDKRALIVLAATVVIIFGYYYFTGDSGSTDVVEVAGSIPASEQRLQQVRRLAAQVPSAEQELKHLTEELAGLEKGLIRSETAQQAQAQLLQILRDLGNNQMPPLEFSAVEIGQVRPLGEDKNYGEALVTVSFDCAIEQLVNLLADLTAQPVTIATQEMRINSGNDRKTKTLSVRLTVSGLVPHRLVPETGGLVRF